MCYYRCVRKRCCKVQLVRIFVAIILCVLFYYSVLTVLQNRKGATLRCICTNFIDTNSYVLNDLQPLMSLVDPSTNSTVQDLIAAEHPSLPVDFLVSHENSGSRCRLVPSLFGIKHNNIYWQQATVGSTVFYLYSASLDRRDTAEGPVVRILAMVDAQFPPTPTCQLYFNRNKSKIISSKAIRLGDETLICYTTDFLHWDYPLAGNLQPYIITCQCEFDGMVADSVSIVSTHCSNEVTNILTIYTAHVDKKKSLALCTKFSFDATNDFSVRLVEWLEASKSWGVQKVTTYITQLHPNVEKVFSYYEENGFVETRPWSNPGYYPNIPSLLRTFYDTQRYALFTLENIPYTDCLLRHIDTHRYVGVWDFDEFLIPKSSHSIPQLLDESFNNWLLMKPENVDKKPPVSYLARGSYFFDDAIDDTLTIRDVIQHKNQSSAWYGNLADFHMLYHIKRSLKVTDVAVHTKAVHDTTVALGLHSHFAILDLNGVTDKHSGFYHWYPNSEAILGHYRKTCQGTQTTCCEEQYKTHLITDKTMWKKGSQIYLNTQNVLEELELL